MLKRTPLFDLHRASGARMVDFGGWEMPLHYGSQIGEHQAVRRASGMFDVSHMRVIDVGGADALPFLRRLLANDAARLEPGKALYSCMLQPDGGVIDDLIAYRAEEAGAGADPGGACAPAPYRLVVNASTAEGDLAWMQQVAGEARGAVELHARPDLALIAVQGPAARAQLARAVPRVAPVVEALRPFRAARAGDWFVARTGYTGEDGCEIALPADQAPGLWRALAEAGVAPCGLGARDTLRLEAGMNLYGNDMDRTVSPLESGLAWTVDLRAPREFIGRAALERQRGAAGLRQLLGLKLKDRGVLRAHQEVATAHGPGQITSGSFSPTLGFSIALARVPAGVAAGDTVTVDLRGRSAAATVCRPPFVRNGKALV
jgi:aminomethyltransferase